MTNAPQGPDMTLEQYRKRREEMEERIEAIIAQFENDTGASVEGVSLLTEPRPDGSDYLVSVDLIDQI